MMKYKVNDPEATDQTNAANELKSDSILSWHYHSRGEKKFDEKGRKLIIIVGLLTVMVVALLVTLTVQAAIFRKDRYKEVCQSEECVKTAARIIEAINRTVDPCQDFYKFACGGWISRNPIPQSQASWDQMSHLREQLLENLRVLLEESNDDNDLLPIKLARALYSTCMDTESVEALGLDPIYETFDRLGLPKEPPLGDEIPPLDIVGILGKAQRILGLNLFLNFFISEDILNTSRNRITMEQMSLGLSQHYLLDSLRFQSELMEFKKYIKAMIEIAGVGNKSMEFANEILNFSSNIARIMTTPEQRRSANHPVYDLTIDKLQQLTDLDVQQWNWTRYLDAVFDDTNVTISAESDHAIVVDLRYLQKLPTLLAETSFSTIVRFVWWNVYATVAPLTLQRFRDLGFQFSQQVFGLKEKTPRWKSCTENVNRNFGMALSYIYTRKHFDDQARQKALEMFLDIKQAFDEMVAELDWMDGNTRAQAHKKLNAMRPFIGIPDWITNSEKLNQFYEGVNVIPARLLDAFLMLTNVRIKKSLNSLREKPDKNRWITSGTTVNAFYSAILNSVTFPAGILHPPFYGNGLRSINYGALGAIMGHEVTHGFDDQGRRYDENGNIRQWWSKETLRHYHEKIGCMIKQYNNYHLPELGDNFTVNGMNTQGENIADNGGIREAYRAYQKYKARNTDPLVLPGLHDYNEEQLFFIGFAQAWCGNYTNGALKSKLVEGTHAPNHFRVIGTLSNNEDFAKAWNCPVDSPMNPSRKCILW
ncbi:PREDICTED: neprilysin-11-like isoform X1 [Eufriesea mexicana]|uniref:neprilysin-11-like isoform X1 n=1 Tax=Eufriesea mexicana TaxID=516756 RepID=UPI00083C404D|nr:PREDICTED: neprilysin-11-like isoform X1 [Eufriesea mexicana]XP_017756931.1 PREDICTED: neprilysin-11-like isoform X1 [Eufriesea mexicana]